MADRTSNISKPLNDAYTGMLVISLLALIGGCVLLWLDYDQYKGVEPPPLKREATVSAPREKAEPKKEEEIKLKDEKKDVPAEKNEKKDDKDAK